MAGGRHQASYSEIGGGLADEVMEEVMSRSPDREADSQEKHQEEVERAGREYRLERANLDDEVREKLMRRLVLFTMKYGLVGATMGEVDVRIGDQVVILENASLPVVVRPPGWLGEFYPVEEDVRIQGLYGGEFEKLGEGGKPKSKVFRFN